MASSRNLLGQALEDIPIYFEDIFCEGDEQALSQCHYHLIYNDDGFSSWFCQNHYYDAGVLCQGMYV